MSLENLLNYSVDNEVVQHYLQSLAERDVKVEQRNTHLTEKLHLCEQALIEVHKTLHATREEANKQLLLSEQKLANTLEDLEETQQQLERIKDAHEYTLLEIERLRDEVDELQLSAMQRLREDASNLSEKIKGFGW
jgi:chromosome segregation ATPase